MIWHEGKQKEVRSSVETIPGEPWSIYLDQLWQQIEQQTKAKERKQIKCESPTSGVHKLKKVMPTICQTIVVIIRNEKIMPIVIIRNEKIMPVVALTRKEGLVNNTDDIEAIVASKA